MQGLPGISISSMVSMAADAKDRSAVVAKDVAILAQAHIDLQAEMVRLQALIPSCFPDGTGILGPEAWVKWASEKLGYKTPNDRVERHCAASGARSARTTGCASGGNHEGEQQ